MKILHIDASGRPGLGRLPPHGPCGSYSRRLGQHFMNHWLASRPDTEVKYRDLGVNPSKPVDHAWIGAAFSRGEPTAGQHAALALERALQRTTDLADSLRYATKLQETSR